MMGPLILLFCGIGTLLAQSSGPEAVLEEGRKLFELNCSSCHGRDGKGSRGPTLESAKWAGPIGLESLQRIIKDGIRGTEMPSFSFDGSEGQLRAVSMYVRTLVGSFDKMASIGDREKGESTFKRACTKCHMANGKGGRLGPDLSSIGKVRDQPGLVQAIRAPDKQISPYFTTVTVVTTDGKRIKGVRRSEDTFFIHVMGVDETPYLLNKKDVKEILRDDHSLMPGYNEQALNSKELQNLVAYLMTLRRD